MPEEDKRSPAIVILVSDYLPSSGGTTTQTRLHALEFLRRGWEVTVISNNRKICDTLWTERRCEYHGLARRTCAATSVHKSGTVFWPSDLDQSEHLISRFPTDAARLSTFTA